MRGPSGHEARRPPMSLLAVGLPEMPKVQHVTVTGDSLMVNLIDGRTISAPIGWYLRLLHGGTEERSNWCLIGRGEGIHWPDLDEDISVENLLAGKASGESQRSFKRWLEERTTRGKQP